MLYLSSDALDTDLFVMLQDVYPPSQMWLLPSTVIP